MVQIQVDLSEEENKKVGLYKAENNIKTKEIAVKKMIMEVTIVSLPY